MTKLPSRRMPSGTLPPDPLPPDHDQRTRALDTGRSILVEAPAGSGKTDLLTRRFLRLLAEVDEPGQIVAITFTRAAAAEMRHRILAELEKAEANGAPGPDAEADAMKSLAWKATERARMRNWQISDLPAQLRISTIDSFCRDLALQQPFLSGLGADLNIYGQPAELYRRAARRTLEKVEAGDARLRTAIEALLSWRDNYWMEMEDLLVTMLARRDSWMHGFVLERNQEMDLLRARLERPFTHAIRTHLSRMHDLLDRVPGGHDEILSLARFACEQMNHTLHRDLAELTQIPSGPFSDSTMLDDARYAWNSVAALLLTQEGILRRRIDKTLGFPQDAKREKERLASLIQSLRGVEGFEAALAAVTDLPSATYSEDEWRIVQACFTVLSQAAAELRVVFAEAGAMDFVEIAQIAQGVLQEEDGTPSEAAIAVADGIHHLLVDEFQDTSRRQHRLLASLVAAWPGTENRSLFVVGDPKQSIYFFRDADAELFPRVASLGLETPAGPAVALDRVSLTANFRTDPSLVGAMNQMFEPIFGVDDGSGVRFLAAEPARKPGSSTGPRLQLHLEFMPRTQQRRGSLAQFTQQNNKGEEAREAAQAAHLQEMVALIRSHSDRIERARSSGDKYRIAVLGRTRTALALVADALHEASIPFRAVELEQLKTRPEILDALALGRALLNPQDRVAWLGVLRAPWCGLSLDDLHVIAGTDDSKPPEPSIPSLLPERHQALSDHGRAAVGRIMTVLDALPGLRGSMPTATLGTWLEQAWIMLGGELCVDSAARANLNLLWSCLDQLPDGAEGLLGPGLDSALKELTALPDPAASSDCGVQLMTIHKSKGLEFEVVIVPDLQARSASTHGKLLSWLERGLPEPDESGEMTEFLVAPLQTRGADRGQAKQWVDREFRKRELQEMRRILYVAATRAREELHLFARPTYKEEQGELVLATPADSLLATAWPALWQPVQESFDAWKTAQAQSQDSVGGTVQSIAASEGSKLLMMSSPGAATTLRRLAPDDIAANLVLPTTHRPIDEAAQSETKLYQRHEGGRLARALGTAVHALLEQLARLRARDDWDSARAALAAMEGRIIAQVRAAGAAPSHAASIAKEAVGIALEASNEPVGQWILSPHTQAASEAAWTGVVKGALRTVRVDRVYCAGPEPLSEGDSTTWLIDYKTTQVASADPAESIAALRAMFAPQLSAYAAVLANFDQKATIHAGLYYPRMRLFDWWRVED